MHRERRYIHFVYLIIDIILITFAFYLPYSFRYSQSLFSKNLPYMQEYLLVFLLWGLSLVYLLNTHRLYSTDRALSIPKETWRVFKCVFFSSLLAGLIIFLLQLKFFSRFIFGMSAVILFLSLSFWRAIKRIFIRYRVARGYYNINVLIVGAGRTGCALAEEIKNHPYLGLHIVGFVDDYKRGKVLSYDILGKVSNLEEIIKRNFVDEIYVTIPSERKRTAEILELGRKLNKTVRIVADNFSFSFPRVSFDYIGFIPLIRYIEGGIHGTEGILKRMFDITVSAILLILLSPLFVIIAILIKLDSPGPVLYISKRCGKKGRIFNFYKFRSMVEGAEQMKESLRHLSEVEGPIFKMKNDPRVTRVGRILRRFSLDELPQLINVLKGDMSLVGPRPPTPDEVSKYNHEEMQRLSIRPGITGLSQVRGRSDITFRRWVKWDLWYINNWSFGLDLWILWNTIPVVLKGKGAY